MKALKCLKLVCSSLTGVTECNCECFFFKPKILLRFSKIPTTDGRQSVHALLPGSVFMVAGCYWMPGLLVPWANLCVSLHYLKTVTFPLSPALPFLLPTHSPPEAFNLSSLLSYTIRVVGVMGPVRVSPNFWSCLDSALSVSIESAVCSAYRQTEKV